MDRIFKYNFKWNSKNSSFQVWITQKSQLEITEYYTVV